MMQSVADGHGCGHGAHAEHTEIAPSIVEVSRGKWLSDSRRERDVAFEDDAALVAVDDTFFNETTDDGVDAWEAIHPNARRQQHHHHRGIGEATKASSRKPPTGAAGQRVVLPPPPSASDDVEQWERAMLVDNQRQHARRA